LSGEHHHSRSRPVLPDEPPDDVMRWYQTFLAIPEHERPWMRSFTVRYLTADAMTIDFVLHGDNGPASAWAASASPGDVLARYESLPSTVTVYLAAEEQPPPVEAHWLPPHASLLDAVRDTEISPSTHVWPAGEAGEIRALRRHLVDDRGIAKSRIDFAGYWRRALTQDDAPTPEDLAEARERVG
jgi:NADPH-dependent ferric siderophore reductase